MSGTEATFAQQLRATRTPVDKTKCALPSGLFVRQSFLLASRRHTAALVIPATANAASSRCETNSRAEVRSLSPSRSSHGRMTCMAILGSPPISTSRSCTVYHPQLPPPPRRHAESLDGRKSLILVIYMRMLLTKSSRSQQDCLYDDWVLKHYCADTCDPSPCADDEVCSLSSAVCFGPPSACWPSVICDNSAHPWGCECTEFQVRCTLKGDLPIIYSISSNIMSSASSAVPRHVANL